MFAICKSIEILNAIKKLGNTRFLRCLATILKFNRSIVRSRLQNLAGIKKNASIYKNNLNKLLFMVTITGSQLALCCDSSCIGLDQLTNYNDRNLSNIKNLQNHVQKQHSRHLIGKVILNYQ